MGEEVRIIKYGGGSSGSSSGGDGDGVSAWEEGLPKFDDIAPLYQHLIPPELALAFRITTGPSRTTVLDVNPASKNIITSFHDQVSPFSITHLSCNDNTGEVIEETSMDLPPEGSDSPKSRGIQLPVEEADSILRNDHYTNDNNNPNMSASNDDLESAKTVKRQRLVWTAKLHKRFVDVVTHVGMKNAFPKTIMQMMNVEGLTRENVASHLQKYRLYLKRLQGSSDEGPCGSDHLFKSTPLSQSLQESHGRNAAENDNGRQGQHQYSGNGHMGLQILLPYNTLPPPQMMHMPMVGMVRQGDGGHGYHGYDAHHNQYSMLHNFGSVHLNHYHVPPNGK